MVHKLHAKIVFYVIACLIVFYAAYTTHIVYAGNYIDDNSGIVLFGARGVAIVPSEATEINGATCYKRFGFYEIMDGTRVAAAVSDMCFCGTAAYSCTGSNCFAYNVLFNRAVIDASCGSCSFYIRYATQE